MTIQKLPTVNRKKGDPVLAEDIMRLIEPYRGNVSRIADAMNCTRTSIYKRLHEHPELQDKLDEVRESVIDAVEDTLINRALSGNVKAIKFFLSTQARHRGYGRKRQVEQYNVNISDLSTEQLEMLISGEPVHKVIEHQPS